MSRQKTINILGTRGIPAAHGGFETFAEKLSLYLVARGWKVSVYNQNNILPDQSMCEVTVDNWNGIRRVHIPTIRSGPAGTIEFDWKCIRHVLGQPGVDLVLGYNTALFTLVQRLRGRSVIMNMDGIEWKRAKWSFPAKAWFFLNEIVGAHSVTQPIADHPEIANHLASFGCHRSVVIPYGADLIKTANPSHLTLFGIAPNSYFVSIARIEPENSILEIVRAFSSKSRQSKLVILGRLDTDNSYHQAVQQSATGQVVFPGPIYDKVVVQALRFFCRTYLHGHQVGGTNPSLVEALGAGNAVIAHDNRFNRWTTGQEQLYFANEAECAAIFDQLDGTNAPNLDYQRAAARRWYNAHFQWETVLATYEAVLEKWA